MAFAMPAPAPKASRPAAGASAAVRGLSSPNAASPAAQALGSKKASGFLQLFRNLVAAARKAPLPAAPAQRAVPGRTRASDSAEFRAMAAEARAARRPRRGARQAGRQALPADSRAAVLPAPAGRAPASSLPPEAASSEVRRVTRPAQARVFVVDLRSPAARGSRRAAETPERGEAPAEGREPSRGFERVLSAREAGSAAPASLTPVASASLSGFAPTSLSGFAPTSLSGFAPSTGLSGQALQEHLVPEIVRQASIILKDGGEGEIRLVLKPEHLGSVRIRLQLGESSLEGRIVVDNSNVKELLEAHLEQLKGALRQEGYASANIDVTVSGGGSGRREPPPEPVLAEVSGRASGFERATPAALDLGFTTVNLLI